MTGIANANGKEGANNEAAAQAHNLAPEVAQETPRRDLGQYEGEKEILSQEQMLGIGGGSLFYELLDAGGTARKHVAMPVLMRDRPVITACLKEHAQIMLTMHHIIEGKGEWAGRPDDEIQAQLEEMEERDIACLVRVAFYCFKRSDAQLKGKDEKEGCEIIRNWIDTTQLQDISRIAMGLNKLSPLRMGGLA